MGAPSCPSDCTNSQYPRPLNDDLFFDSRSKRPRWTENTDKALKYMLEGGPIAMGFDVYQDFMSYKSGYYNRRTSRIVGGHATTAIGWTTWKNSRHIISVNSWGSSWGEHGRFKMHMECCALDYHIPFVTSTTYESLPLPTPAPTPPPPKKRHAAGCEYQTGGTCKVFGCKKWRDAYCSNGDCVCRPGTCSSGGRCIMTKSETITRDDGFLPEAIDSFDDGE